MTPAAPLRVLIIDDDPDRAVPILEGGHDVRIAHGFAQVRFWLTPRARGQSWRPDVVLLDYDMPGFDGSAVVRYFGSALPPTIVWSMAGPQATKRLADGIQSWGVPCQIHPWEPDSAFWDQTLRTFLAQGAGGEPHVP